jgi:hypothetical protein
MVSRLVYLNTSPTASTKDFSIQYFTLCISLKDYHLSSPYAIASRGILQHWFHIPALSQFPNPNPTTSAFALSSLPTLVPIPDCTITFPQLSCHFQNLYQVISKTSINLFPNPLSPSHNPQKLLNLCYFHSPFNRKLLPPVITFFPLSQATHPRRIPRRKRFEVPHQFA